MTTVGQRRNRLLIPMTHLCDKLFIRAAVSRAELNTKHHWPWLEQHIFFHFFLHFSSSGQILHRTGSLYDHFYCPAYEFLFCSLHLKAYFSKEGLEVLPRITWFFPTHQTSLFTCEQQSCPRHTGLQSLPKPPPRNGFHGSERDSNPGP